MRGSWKYLVGAAVVALGFGNASVANANSAGFVALEGSDATALHHDPVYTPELFKYLEGTSTLPVLVYNPTGVIDLSAITGGVAVSNQTSLVGLMLSDYAAIYIESPGGCCQADNTVLNGFGSAVKSFILSGGNLSIENYVGGDYDGTVPGGAAPFGAIQGFGVNNGGVGSGPGCTDGKVVNATGIAKGFSQPPVDGCWEHQGYENSYWLGQGYISLIDAATNTSPFSGGFGYTYGDGTQIGSGLLAFGGTLGASVPEPATLALLGAGLVGLGLVRRRRS